MTFLLQISSVSILLFLGTLAMLELGRRARRRSPAPGPEEVGLGAVEGAIFTLLGLLLAFTFSGAAARFDTRKQLIAEEVNRVATAWLRLELLPAAERPALQALFREYLDERIEGHRHDPASPPALQSRARATALQGRIWSAAVDACPHGTSIAACTLLLPALNEMIDITTTRLVARWIHPPTTVYVMLLSLVLVAALLTGYGTGQNPGRSWLHRLLFAAAITTAVFVTLDLEYPRAGLIRVEAVDRLMVELRGSFEQ